MARFFRFSTVKRHKNTHVVPDMPTLIKTDLRRQSCLVLDGRIKVNKQIFLKKNRLGFILGRHWTQAKD